MQWRQTAQQAHKPVIIMLTDSGDWDKQNSLQTLQQIMSQEAQLPDNERMTLHMIGFGPDVDRAFVQQLANIGNGSYLVCQTGGDVDRLDLVKAFGQLAAQPALKVSLLQQLRGGAAGSACAHSCAGSQSSAKCDICHCPNCCDRQQLQCSMCTIMLLEMASFVVLQCTLWAPMLVQ